MSKNESITSLRNALQTSQANESTLRAMVSDAAAKLNDALTKLGAAGQVRKDLENERDAMRSKVDELKRLLHAAEIEAARLGGVVGRMREEEASAALPVVETTQKTTSRQLASEPGLYSANLDNGIDFSGGYPRRPNKHWTAL